MAQEDPRASWALSRRLGVGDLPGAVLSCSPSLLLPGRGQSWQRALSSGGTLSGERSCSAGRPVSRPPGVQWLSSPSGLWIQKSGVFSCAIWLEEKYERGEHGNPLQDSCPENPKDRGAWRGSGGGGWLTVHGVAKSRTWPSDQHLHFSPRDRGVSKWEEIAAFVFLMYLFTFTYGCAGSWLMCVGFSCCGEWGLLIAVASLVAERGL